MELKELVMQLCNCGGFGGLRSAADKAVDAIAEYADEVESDGKSVTAVIRGSSDRTLMFDAHIDEIGMVVTSVSDDGFLKVAAAGGIDARILAAQPVCIYGADEKCYGGVFCSTPPHLKKEGATQPTIDKMCIDTGLGEKAKDLIPPGSRVTFAPSARMLSDNTLAAKSLDDRAGIAALIEAARLIRLKGTPEYTVIFLFSDAEELSARGAKTRTFAIDPQKAIAVDVSFGNTPNVDPDKTAKLGTGAMIGVSPALSYPMSDKLKSLADSAEIPYTVEVMGGRTGTNADVISVNRAGVETGLISIPIRNMHTPQEVVDLGDIENTARLLCEYAVRG